MKMRKSKLTFLMVSFMMLGFTACDKNDDPVKKTMLTDVYGNYSGKMTMTMVMPHTYGMAPADDGSASVDITAMVNNDTVSFAKFPVEGIIQAILPEEEAAGVIALLGDIKYAAGYKAEFNAAKDSVVMEFDPKPLELKFSTGEGEEAIETSIKVDISAVSKGSYAIGKRDLKFILKATGVTVGGAPFEGFPETLFDFDMNKK